MEFQKSVIFIKKCGFCPPKNQKINFSLKPDKFNILPVHKRWTSSS